MKIVLQSLLAICVLIGTNAAFAEDHANHNHAMPGINSMDVYTQGARVHLLLGERPDGGAMQLQYLHSDDGGKTFSAPVRVDQGQLSAEPAHRGADAQIAAFGDHVIAAWTLAGDDKMGRGPIALAISNDAGKTWKPGPNPADDHATGGHAFIDIAADSNGVFHLVWIDSRGPGKGLRYSRSTDGGATWSKNVTLDASTCECCWNTIAISSAGQLSVLYRQHEPRDMAIITSADSGLTWSHPIIVGQFNWDIDACPHVGGGLIYTDHGRDLCATVWSGNPATHGAFVLTSHNGRKWSEPEQLANSKSWHTDLAGDDEKNLVSAWDSYTDDGQAIFTARSTDGGKHWSEAQRLTDPGLIATHPRVICTPAGFAVLWTQHAEGKESVWVLRKLSLTTASVR